MGRPVAKSRVREKREILAKRSELINAALEDGQTTKKQLAKSAGIEIWQLNDVFKENKDLHLKFNVRRRTLADTAADNLEEILKDPDHPQHFQATKYVLQTYKTDIDENLESKEAEEMEVSVRTESETAPVVVRFGKSKRIEEEED